MSKNFLFLVEGKKTEPNLLSAVFEKYGFHCISTERQERDGTIPLDISKLSDEKNNIVIAQCCDNRLEVVLKKFQDTYTDLNKILDNQEKLFSGIFLIFDVDHTGKVALEEISNRFNNESDGLLLISSPCIEILSEPDRNQPLVIKEHFEEYKKECNLKICDKYNCSVAQYISEHFEENVVKFLKKNHEEFSENNVSLHPMMVVKKVNENNDRMEDGSAIIRYFTTVIYVAIAYVKGLLKNENNYNDVLNFFE